MKRPQLIAVIIISITLTTMSIALTALCIAWARSETKPCQPCPELSMTRHVSVPMPVRAPVREPVREPMLPAPAYAAERVNDLPPLPIPRTDFSFFSDEY